MPARKPIDMRYLRQLHSEGVSVLQMSKRLGVSRPLILRRLKEAGLPVRTATEANRIRMAALTADERRALAVSANAARRITAPRARAYKSGDDRTRPALSSAVTRSRTLSVSQPIEAAIAERALHRGVALVPQVAVGGYNLDFCAFGRIAVELHSSPYNPLLSPDLARRTEGLISAGWAVLYLWRYGDRGCDQILSWLDGTGGDIPGQGEYRMVRGDGEVMTVDRAQLHERALLSAPRHVEYVIPRPGD